MKLVIVCDVCEEVMEKTDGDIRYKWKTFRCKDGHQITIKECEQNK